MDLLSAMVRDRVGDPLADPRRLRRGRPGPASSPTGSTAPGRRSRSSRSSPAARTCWPGCAAPAAARRCASTRTPTPSATPAGRTRRWSPGWTATCCTGWAWPTTSPASPPASSRSSRWPGRAPGCAATCWWPAWPTRRACPSGPSTWRPSTRPGAGHRRGHRHRAAAHRAPGRRASGIRLDRRHHPRGGRARLRARDRRRRDRAPGRGDHPAAPARRPKPTCRPHPG